MPAHLPPVAILTSGIGLGVYMPALLIQRQMRARGAEVEVVTLEGLYTAEGRERHVRHQQAFHTDFALALMGHRMPKGTDSIMDRHAVASLLGAWADRGLRNFIVWSGFWLPLLESYQQRVGAALALDCCRIDAIVSPSFKVQGALPSGAREIWLWSWQERRTVFEIPVDERPPQPFGQRARRLVVHGGGWGVGTYLQAREALASSDWALDTVVHGREEVVPGRPRDPHGPDDRWFAVAPGWRTWQARGAAPGFPPFGQMGGPADGHESGFRASPGEHGLFEVIRESKAIVSKPGGGTLIDSLASATPVVLLEPLGEAETANGKLWEELGFGVSFARWRQAGFSEALLDELHANFLRRPRGGPDYPADYVARLEGGGLG